MKLFSVKYYFDNGIDVTFRRAIVCAKDEDDAENILIKQEEKPYDTFVSVDSIDRIFLKEPKVIIISELR